MQIRDIANAIRFLGRLLAWCFLILGVALTGFGVWMWLAHRNDDIASIMGGVSIFGGICLVGYVLPAVVKRRRQEPKP